MLQSLLVDEVITLGKGVSVRIPGSDGVRAHAPGEKMWDGGKLWPVPRCVVVQFEEGDGKKLHVFGHSEDLCR